MRARRRGECWCRRQDHKLAESTANPAMEMRIWRLLWYLTVGEWEFIDVYYDAAQLRISPSPKQSSSSPDWEEGSVDALLLLRGGFGAVCHTLWMTHAHIRWTDVLACDWNGSRPAVTCEESHEFLTQISTSSHGSELCKLIVSKRAQHELAHA